jgi:hypothetical protein
MTDQPRVPAGSPEGGQWTSKNGGTIASPSAVETIQKFRADTYRQNILAYKDDLTQQTGKVDPEAVDFYKKYPTQEAFDTAHRAALQQVADNSVPGMRIPLSVLTGQIALDGEFKSTFETRKTGAKAGKGQKIDAYTRQRAEAEDQLMQISQDSTVRPKYGVLINRHDPEGHVRKTGDWLDQYGDATVIFKPNVRDRTTFTENDSLDSRGFRLPSPLNKASELSGFPGYSVGEHMRALKVTQPDAGMFYHEAQYHGRLGVEDIHHVYLNKPPSSTQQRKLESMSKKNGFTWSVVS